MQISRGRARFEARDPPASRLLKRSPHVGRHLRSEGSDVSVAELRNRDAGREAASTNCACTRPSSQCLRSGMRTISKPFPIFIVERASG
jgi:hypothetical protein